MFISNNNYLFGILMVIGYWVAILNARPSSSVNDTSRNDPDNDNWTVSLINETFRNLSKDINQSLHTTGLPRILFHGASDMSSGPLIDFEDYTDTQDIIFPDSYESDGGEEDEEKKKLEKVFALNERPNCKVEDTFCERIASYPYRQMKVLLEKSDVPKIFFGVDEAPDEIANRLGEQEENFVCESIDRTIYPQIGKTKNQKWKYIVNQGESGYVQGVKIEICRNKDGPCDLIKNHLPSGYVSGCKQKYVYRRLLSIADEGKRTVRETFQMPSACCCSYRKDPYFLSNFGNPISPIFGRKNKRN